MNKIEYTFTKHSGRKIGVKLEEYFFSSINAKNQEMFEMSEVSLHVLAKLFTYIVLNLSLIILGWLA